MTCEELKLGDWFTSESGNIVCMKINSEQFVVIEDKKSPSALGLVCSFDAFYALSETCNYVSSFSITKQNQKYFKHWDADLYILTGRGYYVCCWSPNFMTVGSIMYNTSMLSPLEDWYFRVDGKTVIEVCEVDKIEL